MRNIARPFVVLMVVLALGSKPCPGQAPAQAPAPGTVAHTPATPARTTRGRTRSAGRLGVTTVRTRVRKGLGERDAAIASLQAGTYLAIVDSRGDRYGVLAADGSVGWVPRSAVKILDYEVITPDARSETPPGHGAVLRAAYTYLGVPYREGGASARALDAPGFVRRCFADAGVRLPKTLEGQFHSGLAVARKDLQPGDRLYFTGRRGRLADTGIYIGSGYFIHASRRRGGVGIERLTDRAYAKAYFGARR